MLAEITFYIALCKKNNWKRKHTCWTQGNNNSNLKKSAQKTHKKFFRNSNNTSVSEKEKLNSAGNRVFFFGTAIGNFMWESNTEVCEWNR